MKKRILILVVALFTVFSNQKLSAQSYKSETLSFYNFVFPENYIPAGYNTYGVKINLSENPILILVDGEKKGTRERLSYNEFFREEYLIRPLAGTSTESNYQGTHISCIADLNYRTQQLKAEDHLIVDVYINNVAYEGEITESKSDTPFSYETYYKFDVVYKLRNSLNDNVIMEKTFKVKERLLGSGSFEGYQANFKTKSEAITYLTANLDKNLIYNALIDNIQKNMKSRVMSWIGVPYYEDSYYFSRISKEDKNPLFLKLNQDVDAIESWSKSKSSPVTDDELLNSNAEFVKNNNLVITDNSKDFQDETGLKNYNNFKNKKKILCDFILKMDGYAKQLDANDKGQKAAIWACYVNIASSFEVLNNYKSSLEYIQKARALDYQENKLKYMETDVTKRQAKRNVFADANGEVKKDVNSNYLKYLNL
ncbi:hypothetical protein [Flavobacterium sp. N1736]|uniref:hypothetical protein n=1 Tax=Flavobacterium sp. N1736 TaxID=2986823 RepID=UPI0022258490|nr:hypothetical protein [Flavobacterium sp. N1736]